MFILIPKPPLSFSFFATPANVDPCRNWLDRDMTYPKPFTAWLKLWRSFSEPIFPKCQTPPGFDFVFTPPPYIPGQIPDPFFHRKEAEAIFEHYFFESQKIRGRIRALIRHRRCRQMEKRLIGEVDVGTLELIPNPHKVRVYDWISRALYQFHTHTIHNFIVAALRYQSYAISMPKAPKNPYTNLEWSLPQLLVLVDQIQRNLWNTRQRHMDSALQTFQMAQLNIEVFRDRVGCQLEVECARSFFRDSHGEEWISVYNETIEDLELFTGLRISPLIRGKLLDRTFPLLLLHQWDELMLGMWGYQNLGRIIINAGSIFDIIVITKTLHDRTMEYIKLLRKKAKPEETDGCT